MKKIFKTLFFSLTLGSMMFIGQGCEKWLDVKDFNKIPFDEFWQTKEDVDGIVAGSYQRFRQSAQRIFLWGELRGDCIELNSGWNEDQGWVDAVRGIKELEINDENTFIRYDMLYDVINRCNQVIKYAPGVLELDNTFTTTQCNQWVAEMKWLRSLCYFYLVRSFRDVPYVTDSYMDDTKPFATAKSTSDVILDKLVAELEDITRPGLDGGHLLPVQPGALWSQKGRGTVYAAYALLADIYLWKEDYIKAEEYCDKILRNEITDADGGSGLFALVTTFTGKDPNSGALIGVNNNNWYNLLFANGNSTESICEIQWAGTEVNPVMELLFHKDGLGKTRLLIPNSVGNLTSGTLFGTAASGQLRNVRGDLRSIRSDRRVWKYSSTAAGDNPRPDSRRNPNFIIYRLTEVYLMKAEALIMKEENNAENYTAAYDIINMIRERGGFDAPHPIQFASEQAGLEYLLLERQREFIAEGKRWFDLVRVALKKDAMYKDLLIDILVADIPANIRDIYRSKLQEPYGYFFPIHKDEIESSGGVVKQNEYYLN